MRTFLALCVLTFILSPARAQDQESKLLDRLLKPNTTLQNSAQNKKFTADGVSIHKRATVNAFYPQQESKPKTFSQTRAFAAWQFNSRSFRGPDEGKVKFLSQQSLRGAERTYLVSSATNLRAAHDANKVAASRDFSGNRPFLGQGKSQKSLSRQNPPLTIEQVRELLNKNK